METITIAPRNRSYSRDQYQNHYRGRRNYSNRCAIIGITGPITEITVGPETGTVTEVILTQDMATETKILQ